MIKLNSIIDFPLIWLGRFVTIKIRCCFVSLKQINARFTQACAHDWDGRNVLNLWTFKSIHRYTLLGRERYYNKAVRHATNLAACHLQVPNLHESLAGNSGKPAGQGRDWNLKWAAWMTSCSCKRIPRTSAWATAFIKWTYFFPREWMCTQNLICVSCACKRANCSRQISIPEMHILVSKN